jgi:hypothetical protein
MYVRQRGATFIGMVIIIAILGFGLYAAIRLVPVYMEYMSISRALDNIARENAGQGRTAAELRIAYEKRWNVEGIKSLRPEDVEIKKSPKGMTMRAKYRAEAPFVANVSLVADFDKMVTVGNEGGAAQ